MEDFAALHLLVDPVFQGKDSPFSRAAAGGGSPPYVRFNLTLGSKDTALRLFRAADQSANAHVKDGDVASRQVDRPFNYNAEDFLTTGVSLGKPTLVGDLDLFSRFDENNQYRRPSFLFEALGQPAATTLTFTVTVTYPGTSDANGPWRGTTRTHAIDLDLRDIKDFYTRMRVPYRDGDTDLRFTKFTEGTTTLPHFGSAEALWAAQTKAVPFLSGTDTVVLVHGWNMTDGTQMAGPRTDWKKAFAETAFKRLYWQGFRGNVTAFDWPTFADTEGPLEDRSIWGYPDAQWDRSWRNLTYNASEYQAWRSGQSLVNYLDSIRSPTGRTHLLAHSMGNVVAAEALRQWSASGNDQRIPLVTTYVAMQGAISAGAYGSDDTGARVGDSRSDLYRHWPSGDGAGADDDYYMRGTEKAAGKWVNMFNSVDAATAGTKENILVPGDDNRTAWPLNNKLKPPSLLPLGLTQSTVWPDLYNWINNYVRGHMEPMVIPGLDGGMVTWDFIADANLSSGLVLPEAVNGRPQPGPSAYEIMAFLAKSEAMPIGTMKLIGPNNTPLAFAFTNIDITTLGLSPAYEDEWPGHSFQFNFDAATTDRFWKEIQSVTEFRSTLPPAAP